MYPQFDLGSLYGGFGGFNPYQSFGAYNPQQYMGMPGLFGGFNPYNDMFASFQTKLDDLFKNYQTQLSQNAATQQQPVVSENSAPVAKQPMKTKGKDGKTYSSMPVPTGTPAAVNSVSNILNSGGNNIPKVSGAVRGPRIQPNTQYGKLINPLQGQTQTTNSWTAR